jgi:two-component system, chemotaxis family, sensor kinase CheA
VSTPPEDRMSELRELFFESAEELVQKLNDEALLLEKTPGDAEASRGLRRTVHTLKGDSAACGFRELSELAHEFEDVLALENPAAASAVPEIALRAADVFAALLEAYRKDQDVPDTKSLRQDIDRLAHAATAPGTIPKPKAKSKSSRQTARWSEYEQLAIARAISDGKRVQHVIVQLDPQCGMPIAARQMLNLALSSVGEVLAIYPPEGSSEPLTQLEAALASTNSAEQIRNKCKIPTVALSAKVTTLRMKPSDAAEFSAGKSIGPSPASGSIANETELVPSATSLAQDVHSPAESPATSVSLGSENILRVDAERIDNVLNLVGELILAKSMLQQTVIEFGERFPKDALRGRFSDAMAFQARVLNDLQRSVMKIRMVPVDQLFRRFPRTVRDVARQCGKEVELVVRGGDTDLDKGILDAIAEPLTHLLRNAVGHGIETSAERIAASKSPQGTLRLSAYHQGNQVVIEVSDDGAGIDVEKVRERAIAQGILKAEDATHLTETETLELIFRPGFSTAEEITELSGRGIGLDVVQSVLSRLKGTVQIETQAGRGTTFRLRLPLTLAIIRALLFRVEQRLYALPLNAVAEITRTTEAAIHEVEQYEVLQLRKDVLPLLRLGGLPDRGPDSAPRKAFVLVISHGERKFGLIVDELAGEEELVIKALDDQSITTDLVSGASILGDGRVVLILNLIALVERFIGRSNEGPRRTGLLAGLNKVLQASPPHVQRPQAHGMAGGQA